MGRLCECPAMDAKRALCCNSSGKLTSRRIITDHMISHYKRIYSAKAAVDYTLPRSMCCNVKYIDQKRRQQIKRDIPEWAQTVKPHTHKSIKGNTTRTCLRTDQGDEQAQLHTLGSEMSSPWFNTSFHCKQTVYPSQMAASSSNRGRASELSYGSQDSQGRCFTHSSLTSTSQKKFKSFQDPMQKTYSGDILLKHTHYFTQEKPFTPRTLKSNSKSTLSMYRYYTCPNRREVEEKTVSKLNQQDAYYGSTNSNGGGSAGPGSAGPDSPLPYCTDHGWSDEESDVFGHYSTANKTKDSDFLLSSSRVSPEGMRSPIMRKATAEEEELLYLEFITDVTNDILAHGIYSDRVLERVCKRHIDMNRHRLNEDKMRHLLDDLQNDLQSPPAASVTALENKERGRSLLLRHKCSGLGRELTSETADDINLLSWTPFDKDKEEPESLLSSMPVHAGVSKSAGTIKQEDENNTVDLEHQHEEGNVKSPGLENLQLNEKGKYQHCTDPNELIKQLDELGRNMSESLNVSETHSVEVLIEQESNVKLCEDEF